MENFQRMSKLETEKERDTARKEFVRDVKKHIDAISSKYILPEEGTMDYALMYVPSESVFTRYHTIFPVILVRPTILRRWGRWSLFFSAMPWSWRDYYHLFLLFSSDLV
jgi:DNA recombination protein RmuC